MKSARPLLLRGKKARRLGCAAAHRPRQPRRWRIRDRSKRVVSFFLFLRMYSRMKRLNIVIRLILALMRWVNRAVRIPFKVAPVCQTALFRQERMIPPPDPGHLRPSGYALSHPAAESFFTSCAVVRSHSAIGRSALTEARSVEPPDKTKVFRLSTKTSVAMSTLNLSGMLFAQSPGN